MSRPPLEVLFTEAENCMHIHWQGWKLSSGICMWSRSQHKSSSLQLCFWQRQHIPAVEHQSLHYYYYHLFPLARAPRSQLRPRTLQGDREKLCIIFYFYMHAWQPVGGLIYGALAASRLQPWCNSYFNKQKIQTKLHVLTGNTNNYMKAE